MTLVTEKSFGPQDVPRVFYLAATLRLVGYGDSYVKLTEEYFLKHERLNELANGVLKGVKGISSERTVAYTHFSTSKDALLIMPGRQTVEQNKLSRVMYDNPHYGLSKNMAALRRLRDVTGTDVYDVAGIFHAIFDYSGLYWRERASHAEATAQDKNKRWDNPYSKLVSQWDHAGIGQAMAQVLWHDPSVAKHVNADNVDDVTSLAMYTFAKVVREQHKNSLNADDYSRADWKKAVEIGTRRALRTFVAEGEWIVKDQTLRVPPRTRVTMLFPYGAGDVPHDALMAAMKKMGILSRYHLVISHVEPLKLPGWHAGETKARERAKARARLPALTAESSARTLTEKSFGPQDVPSVFYLAASVSPTGYSTDPDELTEEYFLNHERLKAMADGVLKGVKGISSERTVVYTHFSSSRDTLLVMPGKQTLAQNKLSRVMYDNPHYGLSKNMSAMRRLQNVSKDDAMSLSGVLQHLFKYSGQYWAKRARAAEAAAKDKSKKWDNPYSRLMARWDYAGIASAMSSLFWKNQGYASGRPDEKSASRVNVNNVDDVTRLAMKLFAELVSDRHEGYLDAAEYSYDEWKKAITYGTRAAMRVFVDEGEWIVKDATLHVPQRTRITMLFPWAEGSAPYVAFKSALKKMGILSRYHVVLSHVEPLKRPGWESGHTKASDRAMARARLPELTVESTVAKLREFVNESYVADNSWLLRYLRDKPLSIRDEFVGDAFMEWHERYAVIEKANINQEDWDKEYEEADSVIYEMPDKMLDAIDKALASNEDWRAALAGTVAGISPATAPSWFYLDLEKPRLLPRETWLIHFSDNAQAVKNHGFKIGMEDMTKLGLTTYYNNDAFDKKYGGYNFAYDTDDDQNVRQGTKYGKEAVMFQSSGVKAWHSGDGEHQVMFYGKYVNRRDVVHLFNKEGEWIVYTQQPSRQNKKWVGNSYGGAYRNESILKCVEWVKQNWRQYRRLITGDRPSPQMDETGGPPVPDRNIPVFVYGTLKRGGGNNKTYLGSATYAGAAAIHSPHFYMVHVGGFPGLIPTDKSTTVRGELYYVNREELAGLDRLEGVPSLYERKAVRICTRQGTSVAWTYVLSPTMQERHAKSRRVDGGDYKNALFNRDEEDKSWDNFDSPFFRESVDERYGGSKNNRVVYFHGTGIKMLPSILSQGLIPNPKQRVWADDPNASAGQVSRASLGGVYVAINLVTATSAGFRANQRTASMYDPVVVVCVEAQSRSLIADEDDYASRMNNVVVPGLVDNAWSAVTYAYVAHQMRDSSPKAASVYKEYEGFYVDAMMRMVKYSYPTMHASLQRRLQEVFRDAYPAVLARQVAYARESASAWKSAWVNAATDFDRTRRENDEYEKAPARPAAHKAEAAFRRAVDAITRTMKSTATAQKDFVDLRTFGSGSTARTLEPIGYSGSNKIICVLTLQAWQTGPKDKLKTYEIIDVKYGKPPAEFFKQHKERRGYTLITPKERDVLAAAQREADLNAAARDMTAV